MSYNGFKIEVYGARPLTQERSVRMVKALPTPFSVSADMDSNDLLVKSGSKENDVWGFTMYPEQIGDDFLEYNSLVNIKPIFGNWSQDIQDDEVKKKISEVVSKHVE